MATIANTVELLTVKDLPFPRTTVWRMRQDGRLNFYKVGSRIYFSPAHLEQLLKDCESRAAMQPGKRKPPAL